MVKRHVKKGRDRVNPDGGIIEKVGTIALANVAVVCPKCDNAHPRRDQGPGRKEGALL